MNRLSDLARRAGINQPEVVIEKAPLTDLERAQEALRNAAVSNDGPTIQDEAEKVRVSLGGKPKGARDAARRKRGTPKKESDFKDGPKPKFLGIKPEKLKKRLQPEESPTVPLDDAPTAQEEPVEQIVEKKADISDMLRDSDPETGLPLDATAHETRAALEEAVASEKARLAQSTDPFRAFVPGRMRELGERQEISKNAESLYFEKLKEYHKGRGVAGIALENYVGELGTPTQIKDLRRAWVRARAEHYTAQQAALDTRLALRPRSKEAVLESLKKYKGKGSIDESKLRERYERVVTMRTFVDGLEERELEKRQEGLNERDKKALDKFYERYKELPPAVRIFGTSAALLGVGAAAGVLLGGSVIGLAPLGLAGTSAALRFWAEKSKNPEAKKWIGGASRFTSVGGAFGALVKMGIEKGHDFRGTETKASALLSNRKDLGDLGDEKNLRRLSQKRKEALVVKESIARQSRIASAFTSLGLGFLFGHHASGGHEHSVEAPDTHHLFGGASASYEYATPTHQGTDLDVPAAAAPAPHEGAPLNTGTEAAPVHPTAPSTSVLEVSTKPGEGFGQLLVDLRHQVGTLEHASPELKHFLEQNPNALTHALGAAHDGQSLTLQPGDKLFVDSDQHVWYQAVGKDPQLVFEHTAPTAEAPDGYVTKHIDGPMQPDLRHHASIQEAPSHSPEVAAAPVEDPSAALNRAQAGGTPILTPETFVDGSDHNTLTQPEELDSTLPSEPAALVPEQVPPSAPVPEQATVTPPAPEQLPPATPEAPVQSALEPFVNEHQVPVEPAVTHLYGVPDESAPGGRQLLVYGGGDATNNEFLRRVQELAREHPGEKIYFEAGKLTMYNGIPQKWITSAVFDPRTGFHVGVTPEGPEMIGVIDPQAFTSRIK